MELNIKVKRNRTKRDSRIHLVSYLEIKTFYEGRCNSIVTTVNDDVTKYYYYYHYYYILYTKRLLVIEEKPSVSFNGIIVTQLRIYGHFYEKFLNDDDDYYYGNVAFVFKLNLSFELIPDK